jgi:hypothetical protein
VPYEHVLALARQEPALLAASPEALRFKLGRLASGLGVSARQALVMAARREGVLDAAPQALLDRCEALGALVDIPAGQVTRRRRRLLWLCLAAAAGVAAGAPGPAGRWRCS